MSYGINTSCSIFIGCYRHVYFGSLSIINLKCFLWQLYMFCHWKYLSSSARLLLSVNFQLLQYWILTASIRPLLVWQILHFFNMRVDTSSGVIFVPWVCEQYWALKRCFILGKSSRSSCQKIRLCSWWLSVKE